MAQLRPCPFCGGEGKFLSTAMDKYEIDIKYEIFCWSCGATTDDSLGKENVINLWNQRPEPRMWFVKDYADGWIAFDNEDDAKRQVKATGALMMLGYSEERS